MSLSHLSCSSRSSHSARRSGRDSGWPGQAPRLLSKATGHWMPTWALSQFGLVVREAAEGAHAFWSCHFLASHHTPWRWIATNDKVAWKRQKICSNVVKPEGLPRPIPGGNKTSCMKWAWQRKPKGEADRRKRKLDHAVSVSNSLCLLSWGETCCFVQFPCIWRCLRKICKHHKKRVYGYSWNIPAPQHCVFYSGSALLWFLRVLYQQVQVSHVSLTFCSEVQVSNRKQTALMVLVASFLTKIIR